MKYLIKHIDKGVMWYDFYDVEAAIWSATQFSHIKYNIRRGNMVLYSLMEALYYSKYPQFDIDLKRTIIVYE